MSKKDKKTSTKKKTSKPAYPGGIDAILDRMAVRRVPFDRAPREGLPPLDIDLAPLTTKSVKHPDNDPREARPFRSDFHRKRYALRREFIDAPELVFLNGFLISHLRKTSWPQDAPALFQRIWAEHGDFLIQHLDQRWLVSTIITFGDHGVTQTQRSLGLSMGVLFGMMKLYESERLFSGFQSNEPYKIGDRVPGPLPMQMDGFAVGNGDLDIHLIGRLWTESQKDDVIGPLARHLLSALMEERSGLFNRLADLRDQINRANAEKGVFPVKAPLTLVPVPASCVVTDPAKVSWVTVSTVKAPLAEIAKFAAHHLDIGAAEVILYLDEPDEEIVTFFAPYPKVTVIECSDAYWVDLGKSRPQAHQLRQTFNASHTYDQLASTTNWVIHLDVDEFLISKRPIAECLAEVPSDDAAAIARTIEGLARDDGAVEHFKKTHRQAGVGSSLLEEIYPTFGPHLHGGFVGHSVGKSFTRTHLETSGIRLGIHGPRRDGNDFANRTPLADVFLGHIHMSSWAEFISKLPFRRSRGSYRSHAKVTSRLGTGELLDFLVEHEGETGLRQFYEEVCMDSEQLRQRLDQHGMLMPYDLDLDAKVARIFGP